MDMKVVHNEVGSSLTYKCSTRQKILASKKHSSLLSTKFYTFVIEKVLCLSRPFIAFLSIKGRFMICGYGLIKGSTSSKTLTAATMEFFSTFLFTYLFELWFCVVHISIQLDRVQ